MTRAVHQLVPVLSPGDGVGQAVLGLRRMLRALGHRSEIYGELIHRSLRREAAPATTLAAALEPGDTVIYHLSIGSPAARLFERLPARRAVYFHNITPRRYYRDISPTAAFWIDRGREDLERLATRASLGLAASAYNAEEMTAAGYGDVAVVPPPVDLGRLRPEQARPSGPPSILYVSRLASNKRQDTVIRALAVLRSTTRPDARLVLPGGADDAGPYAAALRDLARRLGVEDAVDLPERRVLDAELRALYLSAHVAVSASEHEGFGMPLLEAMAFGLPIVARAAAAIPETVADAGLLIPSDDSFVWAAAIERVLADPALRAQLVAAGRRRLDAFDDHSVQVRLAAALERVGTAA